MRIYRRGSGELCKSFVYDSGGSTPSTHTKKGNNMKIEDIVFEAEKIDDVTKEKVTIKGRLNPGIGKYAQIIDDNGKANAVFVRTLKAVNVERKM